MELKELEYIVAIAEEGGISRAAQKLYLAQSSLSQYLNRCESELGTKLFIRTAGGVRMTAAGEVYVRNAKQMLQQYHRVRTELKESSAPRSGRISFGVSSFRGRFLIPPVLKRFQNEYPTVDIVISEHDSSVLLKKIAAGELDMALVALKPGQMKEGDVKIMRDEIVIVANRAHPAMEYVHYDYPNRPWVDLRDLSSFEFLLSNRSTVLGSSAYEMFEAHGIKPNAINENLTAAFSAELACQGLGLAFTYASCASQRTDVEYLSLGEDKCYVDLVLCFPPDGYRSRSNRALEKMICDYFQD